jgi:hypothetical protein
MKVRIGEYDPTQLTIDDAEALRDAGMDIIMTTEKNIAVFMEIGNLFPICDKEDMLYDLEFKPDGNRVAAGGV